MNVQILGKRLLVSFPETETKTAAGVILAGEVKVSRSRGTIVRVGDEAPDQFEEGLEVMFTKAGKATVNDVDYGVVDCEDVFLIYGGE